VKDEFSSVSLVQSKSTVVDEVPTSESSPQSFMGRTTSTIDLSFLSNSVTAETAVSDNGLSSPREQSGSTRSDAQPLPTQERSEVSVDQSSAPTERFGLNRPSESTRQSSRQIESYTSMHEVSHPLKTNDVVISWTKSSSYEIPTVYTSMLRNTVARETKGKQSIMVWYLVAVAISMLVFAVVFVRLFYLENVNDSHLREED
jgi:hypothetical protein